MVERFLRQLLQFFQSSLSRKRFRLYYYKLFKASLLISIVPIIVLSILVLYNKITYVEGLVGAILSFLGSVFFVRPYLSDLTALTNYVEQLSLDRGAKAPLLSFLSNVEELSQAVEGLHNSWGAKKIRLEAALAESRILFDTLPDILIMLDENKSIVRANQAAFQKLGKNIRDRKLKEVLSDTAVLHMVDVVMERGHGDETEVNIVFNEVNRDFLLRVEKFPIHTAGGISAVLILHDITESKRARQTVKDFVANASHEIRTPLTSIVGFVETLQSLDNDDVETRQKFLAIIAEQAEHMTKLVGELLSLSRIELNEGVFPDDKVNVLKVLDTALKRTEWEVKKKDMQVVLEAPKTLPGIYGDKDELVQVFINLVSNAVKYGHKKTDIHVQVRAAKKSECRSERFANAKSLVYVSVTDKGEGISDQDIPRLTERFFRVDKVRSRKVGGTGLGLAIVKHILNRHRGELKIVSKLGKGSTFAVYLPVE